MNHFLFAVFFAITSFVTALGQANERDQARMAQAYERSGDMRNAARLYQELYAASPNNEMYFEGIVRTLQALEQLPGLYPIVEKHAKRTRSVQAYIVAGTLAAKLNKTSERDEFWKQARELSGNEESALVAIGRAQLGVFLFQEALSTFLDARKQNGAPTAYQDEVLTCLVSTGKIENAVDESLTDFTDEQDLPLVVKRLSAVLANNGAAEILDRRLTESESTGPLLRLSLWFYRQQKNADKAMKAAQALDERSPTPGTELLAFADGARNDEQYGVAIRAYRSVMDRTKDQRLQTSAAYGAVRALEQQLRAAKSMTPDDARAVVVAYDDVISRFAQHPLAADALYYSALILDEILGKTDEAQRRLLRLTSFWKGAHITTEAAMRLADIYLAQGQDTAAREQLELVLNLRNGVNEKIDVARLRLADMELWRGNDSAARSRYEEISGNPSSIAANDALDKLLLLQLRQDDSVAVTLIIQAEEFFLRRRYADAVSLLTSQLETVRDNDLKDRGSYLAARSCIVLGDTLKAEPFLLSILQRIPESIYGDQSLWMLATVSEFKNDVKTAMQYLESLLVYYPRSILIPDARERIRKLRGDA
jgi:tetratricopeptide (TPR) repeat protein